MKIQNPIRALKRNKQGQLGGSTALCESKKLLLWGTAGEGAAWRGGLWAPGQVSRTPHPRGLLLTPAFLKNCDTVYMTKFTRSTTPKCPVQWHLACSQCQAHRHGPIPERRPPQAGDPPPWRSPSASLPAGAPAFFVWTHLLWTLHTAESHSMWPFGGAFPA